VLAVKLHGVSSVLSLGALGKAGQGRIYAPRGGGERRSRESRGGRRRGGGGRGERVREGYCELWDMGGIVGAEEGGREEGEREREMEMASSVGQVAMAGAGPALLQRQGNIKGAGATLAAAAPAVPSPLQSLA